MEFEELLESLAEACGIDRLEPDDTHMVHLGSEGTALTIVGDPEPRMIVLFSEIADLPLEGREAFYEQALKANWLFQGGGGATLAINPDSGALSLNQALPMAALDGALFVQLVQNFLEFLQRWRQRAIDWRGAKDESPAKGADDATAAGDSFANFGDEQMIRI